jgi:hypothetical protein
MASTSGNGSSYFKLDAGSVMPHTPDNAGGYQPSAYVSNHIGGKKQNGGSSLAFSELKGGKRKSKKASKKSSKNASKKVSKKRKTVTRGKKTMKTTLKGLLGFFKK